jgi:hypothetical protein
MIKRIDSVFRVLCRWEIEGNGGTSGVVIDDPETFRLDNIEYELAGGE